MITLEEAIKIAESERNIYGDGTVTSIHDCGDRWAFTFKADIGKIGTAPAFVFKDSGKFEFFFYTVENVAILMKATLLKLPEELAND